MAEPLPLVEPECLDIPADAPPVGVVADHLLSWYRMHGRTFSWRVNADAFYVLLAEILLRKTVARVVEEHLSRIWATYPSPHALAAASVADLASSLAPLGLSRQRAQQLQSLAEMIVCDLGGNVPTAVQELERLPGVGSYTAAIVASTCFSVPVPAVDTNVARLLCRVFSLRPSHLEARKSPNVWRVAAALMRQVDREPAHLTWAELDLASSVCTSRSPLHSSCPLRSDCLFVRRSPDVASLPSGE